MPHDRGTLLGAALADAEERHGGELPHQLYLKLLYQYGSAAERKMALEALDAERGLDAATGEVEPIGTSCPAGARKTIAATLGRRVPPARRAEDGYAREPDEGDLDGLL